MAEITSEELEALEPETFQLEIEQVLTPPPPKPVSVFVRNINELSNYEIARVVGTRANQIDLGAPPTIPIEGLTTAYQIARRELELLKSPLVIIRTLPNGGKVIYHLNARAGQ